MFCRATCQHPPTPPPGGGADSGGSGLQSVVTSKQLGRHQWAAWFD